MIINHNMNAMNAHRNMSTNTVNAGKSMEKLSSGLRINRAGDDAAGLAISEKMRGQIRGLDQASRNAQDGISMIQTAEGALNETHSILQRMRELSTQASNDTNTIDDRKEIQKEMNQLTSEINRIGNTTEFNTQKLLNGNKAGNAQSAVEVGDTINSNASKTINGLVITATEAGVAGEALQVEVVQGTGNSVAASAVAASGKLTITLGTNASGAALTPDADALAALTITGADAGKFSLSGGGTTAVAVTTAANLTGGTKTAATGDVQAATDGKATLQIGANQDQSFTVEINDMRANALGLSGATGTSAAGATDPATNAVFAASADTDKLTDPSMTGDEYALDVTSNTKASAAIKVIDKAIASVSSERSKLGAYQNRLEHTIANLGTASENLTSAESRVRDVDMAKEMMNFSKNNILSQAAQAMLAQANQQPQGVLQLLR